MPKVIPKTFNKYYEQFCKENKVKSKLHLLNNKHLKINADKLEKEDWTPIIKALNNHCNDLHSINLYSVYLKKPKKSITTKSRSTVVCEPAFLKESLLKTLIETVATCISKSDILCSVSLEAFPLDANIEVLSSSINNQKHLQHLALPFCKLSEEDLINLCRIVSIHTGLKTINLAGCDIGIKGAQQIATLIRRQKLVRYGETWKQSLRYRLPDPDIVPGLCRLTLNDNTDIGDEGFSLISHELLDDLWIRAIDFQNCGITNVSGNIALDLVENNCVLKILDLRRNNMCERFLTDIMSFLQKGETHDNTYDWIDSNLSGSTVASRLGIPSRTRSALTCKTNRRTMNVPQTALINRDRKLKSLQELPNNSVYKTNDIVGELERTKNILHKVSSKLCEERNKREILEKQHKECKTQLQGIRTYLKQYSCPEELNKSSDFSKPTHNVLQNTTANKNKYNKKHKSKSIKTVIIDKNITTKRIYIKEYQTNSPNSDAYQQLNSAPVYMIMPNNHKKRFKLA